MLSSKIIRMGGSEGCTTPLPYRKKYNMKIGDMYLWRDDGTGRFTLQHVRAKAREVSFDDDQKAEARTRKTSSRRSLYNLRRTVCTLGHLHRRIR